MRDWTSSTELSVRALLAAAWSPAAATAAKPAAKATPASDRSTFMKAANCLLPYAGYPKLGAQRYCEVAVKNQQSAARMGR
jgi:hypothetical protein